MNERWNEEADPAEEAVEFEDQEAVVDARLTELAGLIGQENESLVEQMAEAREGELNMESATWLKQNSEAGTLIFESFQETMGNDQWTDRSLAAGLIVDTMMAPVSDGAARGDLMMVYGVRDTPESGTWPNEQFDDAAWEAARYLRHGLQANDAEAFEKGMSDLRAATARYAEWMGVSDQMVVTNERQRQAAAVSRFMTELEQTNPRLAEQLTRSLDSAASDVRGSVAGVMAEGQNGADTFSAFSATAEREPESRDFLADAVAGAIADARLARYQHISDHPSLEADRIMGGSPADSQRMEQFSSEIRDAAERGIRSLTDVRSNMADALRQGEGTDFMLAVEEMADVHSRLLRTTTRGPSSAQQPSSPRD